MKFLFFFFLLIVCLAGKCKSKSQSTLTLFIEPDKDLVQITEANYERTIYNQPHALIALFYSYHCSHCKNFAPEYELYTFKLARWKRYVRLAAICCESNPSISAIENIRWVPQLKYYPPRTNKTKNGMQIIIPANLYQFEEQIIQLFEHQSAEQKEITGLFSLDPVIDLDVLKWRQQIPEHLPGLIIVEKSSNLIGKRLLLDFGDVQDRVRLVSVLDNAGFWMQSVFNHTNQYPLILNVSNNGSTQIFASLNERPEIISNLNEESKSEAIREHFYERICNLIGQEERVWSLKKQRKSKGRANIYEPLKNREEHPVYTRDLNNALRHAFFGEVLRFRVLDKKQINALSQLMNLLLIYYPYDNENTRRFLKRNSQWLREKRHLPNITVDSVKAIFRAGSEGFLPTDQPYLSCRGSSSTKRGYSCSVWLLFHVLTVAEYRYNRRMPVTHRSEHQVLLAMKNYVENFFFCGDCAAHFMEMAKELPESLNTPNASILWLWKAHNRVNKRTHGQESEDPLYPKRVFPPSSICSDCRLKAMDEDAEEDWYLVEDDSAWNHTRLVQFLKQHYSAERLLKGSAFHLSSPFFFIICLVITHFVRFMNHA